MIVRDLMKKSYLQILPESSLPEAYHEMLGAESRGACVVTEDGQIAGFVSEGDFIRATIPSATDIALYEKSIIDDKQLPEEMVRNLRYTKVEDIMTANIISVDAEEPILNALALLHVHNLKHLPVLDGEKLVGTISRADLLRNLLIDRPISELINP